MWGADDVQIELEAVDREVALIRISTPAGELGILGAVRIVERVLTIGGAHVDGPGRGVLGRHGLNAIGTKLLVVADVDEIHIQGSTRTTGRNKGRAPKLFRYPR